MLAWTGLIAHILRFIHVKYIQNKKDDKLVPDVSHTEVVQLCLQVMETDPIITV